MHFYWFSPLCGASRLQPPEPPRTPRKSCITDKNHSPDYEIGVFLLKLCGGERLSEFLEGNGSVFLSFWGQQKQRKSFLQRISLTLNMTPQISSFCKLFVVEAKPKWNKQGPRRGSPWGAPSGCPHMYGLRLHLRQESPPPPLSSGQSQKPPDVKAFRCAKAAGKPDRFRFGCVFSFWPQQKEIRLTPAHSTEK